MNYININIHLDTTNKCYIAYTTIYNILIKSHGKTFLDCLFNIKQKIYNYHNLIKTKNILYSICYYDIYDHKWAPLHTDYFNNYIVLL